MRTGGDRRNDLAMVGSVGNQNMNVCYVTAVTSLVTSLETVPRPNRMTVMSHSRNPIILLLVRGVVAHDRVTIGIGPRWRVKCLMRNSSSVPRETGRQGRGVIGS